jgi:ATP-dependent DNA ligase
MREPLEKRREVLEKKVLPKLPEPVRYSAPLTATLSVLLQSVKVHGFEGLVAKRCNSAYEPDLRTGAWVKMRVNRGQEFVIGGYTRGTKTFDALIFGYFEGDTLFLEWTADNHLRHSEFVGLREDKKARGCRPRMRPVQLVSSPAARDNLQ